jgi:CubicO group peptidase (beta-lactamase class C family)
MFPIVRKCLSLAVLSLFMINNLVAQATTDTASITRQLDQLKGELGKNYAFALYKDGKTIYKKDNGEFNLKTQQPVNATSHWLTAALVMVLVQEGKLGLDDKVSTYLPIFSKHGKGYITVRHCLTHHTGIDGGKPFEKKKFKTLEEEVNHYASSREIKTNPGTEYYYSNTGFAIAARVLEIVSKKSFDRLMKEKLTSPLAMRATTFASDNYNDAPDPATGAKSTAFDLVNFLAMLLNQGTFNNKQILTKESVQTFLSLQAPATGMKNAPKHAEGFAYSHGAWIIQLNEKNEPESFTAPALSGTFPVIDVCRGYAFVLFTKDNAEDIKKETYMKIKQAVDSAIASTGCN